MAQPEPLREEVWDVRFPVFGIHPAVVLTVNPLNGRLGHVAVIPVSGIEGPKQPHVALTAGSGLARYPASYANVTSLQPVTRSRSHSVLRRRTINVSCPERDHNEPIVRH